MIHSFNALATTYLNAAEMSNVTIVLLYAALLVIVTSIISLRTNDPDPMLAGRNMPWWLIAGSIVGTYISSIAFLAIPTKGYLLDFNFILGNFFECSISVVIAFFFFVSFLRKTRDASIYTLLSDRFGRWAAVYASVAFIIYSTVRMGVITSLVAQAIHLICGADVLSVMLLTGAIVIFYTYMSGIEGVIWTDFFQTFLLIVAGIASVYFLMNSMDHDQPGWLGAAESLIFSSKAGFDQSIDWATLIPLSLFLLTEGTWDYSADQGIGQRYLVARSDGHAKWGLVAGGALVPFVIWLFFAIGLLLYLFYQSHPEIAFDATVNNEGVFAHFIANYFPNGLKGLAIIGILAAAMSTIDTGINSSSTVLICNLYEPYANASLLKKSLLTTQILRNSSLFFGASGILAAYIVYASGENAFDAFWKGIGIIIPGIFGLFLLMRISKKAGPKSAMTGLISGLLLCLWMTFTAEQDHPLASPFHYLLAMPISVILTVSVGIGCSFFYAEKEVLSTSTETFSPKLQAKIAERRKRRKLNIFADSLKPNPFYRIYATIGVFIGGLLYIERSRLALESMDIKLLVVSIIALGLVAIIPFFIKNTYNKRYACVYLTLLGIALPFLGAMALFAHPDNPMYGYFYLVTLAGVGTMLGWTMLGLVSMIATATAGQIAPFLYPQVGIPDNWAMISIGALGVFTYYAMNAARENIITEKALSRIHNIINKIHDQVAETSVELLQLKREPSFKDADRLIKTVSASKDMLSALIGATDISPEESRMELSVKETLVHVLKRFSKKAQQSLTITGDDDFNVLGSRDIFENIVFHVLDNAFYYVERNQASKVIVQLNAQKKTLSILNNGPAVKPEDSLYIFDLGYTSGKDSLGLGLTYCKKMLEGMRSGIRLLSKPNDPLVHFCLYFPKYAQLPPEAQIYKLNESEG